MDKEQPDITRITETLLEPTPDSCLNYSYEDLVSDNGRTARAVIDYKMDIGKMIRLGLAVRVHNILLLSPQSSMCVFSSLS